MRHQGKTQLWLEALAQQLNEGKEVFVAGLKTPQDYINRLNREFSIVVQVIPHYVTTNYDIRFEDVPPYRVFESRGERKLTGYEFKKL